MGYNPSCRREMERINLYHSARRRGRKFGSIHKDGEG